MFKSLFWIQWKGIFAGSTSKQGKTGKNTQTVIAVIAIVVFFISFSIPAIMFFRTMFSGLADQGLEWVFWVMVGFMSVFMGVLSSVFSTYQVLFSARDSELLLSLPIPPKMILGVKVLTLYFLNLITQLVFLFYASVGFLRGGGSAGSVFFALLCFLFLPLFAQTFGIFLAALISFIARHIPFKNFFIFIISLAGMGGYYYFVIVLSDRMGELIQAGIVLAEAFSRWIPPLYLLGTAIQYRSITAFLQYILWMVLPLAIVFGVLSLFFRKLMTKKEATIRVAYKGKVEKRKPLYMALVEREVRRLMSLPMVVLNTCLGAIAAVFLAGVIIVRRDLFLTLLAEFGEIIDPTMMHAAASVMLMFLTMANSLSASSLSLEGQQLWNLKSLPIKSKDILLSKALYAFTLAYAPTLLVVAVYMVSFSVPLKMLPLFLLPPASAAVFSSLLGVWLNVAFPKLEWSNETVAVKQGMSVFLHMMVSLALMAGFVFIYLKYLMKNMSLVSYAYVLSAVFLSLSAFLYVLVVTKSAEKFHQMDA
ncbi:MAG: hypothetical protein GX260_05785 [Tissierellia bacterium]|nr:hypothetical protein [Bacillota bacterium]NLL23276.1 hypothetical protein [Tissierellia bacterium]